MESHLQTHPGGDDLVRLLDGELDPGEHEHLDLHLGSCRACAREMETIRHRRARLEELLRAVDVQPDAGLLPPAFRPVRRPRPGMRSAPVAVRWAAAIAALLLVGALAGPLRATVAEWLARRWSQVSGSLGGAEKTSPVPRNAPAISAPGSGVRLLPTTGEFVLEFDARQAGGTLTVARGDGPHVSVEAVGEGTAAPILVLPRGVHVRNTSQSTASYHLTVPAGLARVRVVIGGRTEVSLAGGMLGSGGKATLDLSRPGS